MPLKTLTCRNYIANGKYGVRGLFVGILGDTMLAVILVLHRYSLLKSSTHSTQERMTVNFKLHLIKYILLHSSPTNNSTCPSHKNDSIQSLNHSSTSLLCNTTNLQRSSHLQQNSQEKTLVRVECYFCDFKLYYNLNVVDFRYVLYKIVDGK